MSANGAALSKAVLLVGGPSVGTRFRPLSLSVPKPLFPIAGVPMIYHQVAALARIDGLREILLIGFYENGVFDRFLSEVSMDFPGIAFKYLREYVSLGTGGGLYHFRDEVLRGNPEYFFVLHADIASSFPLSNMLAFHKSVSSSPETAPLCTIMGTRVPKDTASRYGCLVSDPATQEILHYVEKPETFLSDLINTGVYIFHPNVFQFMAQAVADRHLQMEREQFENNMYALPTTRSVPDMGTLAHNNYGFAQPFQSSYTPYHDYTYNYQSPTPLHTEADVVRLEVDVLRGLAGAKSMFVYEIDSKEDFWLPLKAAQSSLAANTMYLQYWSKTAPSRLARIGGFGILGNGDQVDPFRGERGRSGVYYHPPPQKEQQVVPPAQTPVTKALHAPGRFDFSTGGSALESSVTDVRAENAASRFRVDAATAALLKENDEDVPPPIALERSGSLVPGLKPSKATDPAALESTANASAQTRPRPQPTHPTLVQPVIIHPTAYIHPTAKVGPNVTVGPRAVIHRGVRVHDAIVLEASEIRHDTIVLHSIIGRECKIGCWCRIEGDGVQAHTSEAGAGGHKISATVLGKEVKVAEECVVRNCVVLPNKELGRSYQNEILM
ncbi:nucleotide-diphospho-sugar transferase [Gonapodya prolifera JEL478]|uniref:mannose-1-phosphate guanylyltransferase n=1 Tax=Gonapodya prolifera (strain JEL478) TaxID=1344416 RepID=A0A139B044_GONPJ|nr:nucleotide-diphospho-sugar transferase [Gonapodya prolifera JEL478]|eukprot:KXS22368.1 nucleotide-diphospho-sugar transferase [Gonapodya prolifera JEL478]